LRGVVVVGPLVAKLVSDHEATVAEPLAIVRDASVGPKRRFSIT